MKCPRLALPCKLVDKTAVDVLTPKQIAVGTNSLTGFVNDGSKPINSISVGRNSACMSVGTAGSASIKCWGFNNSFQLGNKNKAPIMQTPTTVDP